MRDPWAPLAEGGLFWPAGKCVVCGWLGAWGQVCPECFNGPIGELPGLYVKAEEDTVEAIGHGHERVVTINRLPHANLRPNARVGWQKQLGAKRDDRADAAYFALASYAGQKGDFAGVPCRYRLVLGWLSHRHRPDDDNARAWVKAMQDGLADYFAAGDDAAWECSEVAFEDVDRAGDQYTRFELRFLVP